MRVFLVQHRDLSALQTCLQLSKFVLRLGLDAKMIKACRARTALADREIYPGIIQIPFGVIGFFHAWPGFA